MLKAIFFDLGDTLFDFEPFKHRAIFEQSGRATYDYLLTRGLRLPPYVRYFRLHFNAIKWAYLWSRLTFREFNSFHVLCANCARLKLNLSEVELKELCWMWYEPLTRRSSVEPDVAPTLARFRDRGLKLAIVSNTFIPGFVLDRHLDLHGLLEFFPVRIYSSEIGFRKPDRRIFQAALHATGVRPDETIFVGDLVRTDIRGARRMGICSVLRQPKAASRTHRVADHVVRRISELYPMLPILGAPPPRPLPLGLACGTQP